MKLIERVFFIIFLLGSFMVYVELSGGALFISISLTILACIYFYLGAALFNGVRLRKIFSKKAWSEVKGWMIASAVFCGVWLSILIVGIMFKALILEGANLMLNIGLIGTIISLIWYALKIKDKTMLVLLSVWVVIGLICI